MQKQFKLGLLAGALALAPLTGQAAKGIEYTFAELGYHWIDGDTIEGDGFRAAMSFAAHEYVHVRASFISSNLDEYAGANADVDVDEFTIGAGGNYSVLDNVDVVAGVVYVVQEYNGDVKEDPEGHIADVGVRAKFMKKLELNGGYLNQELQGENTDGFFVGAVFDLNRDFSVSFRAEDADDDDQTSYFLGLRLHF